MCTQSNNIYDVTWNFLGKSIHVCSKKKQGKHINKSSSACVYALQNTLYKTQSKYCHFVTSPFVWMYSDICVSLPLVNKIADICLLVNPLFLRRFSHLLTWHTKHISVALHSIVYQLTRVFCCASCRWVNGGGRFGGGGRHGWHWLGCQELVTGDQAKVGAVRGACSHPGITWRLTLTGK